MRLLAPILAICVSLLSTTTSSRAATQVDVPLLWAGGRTALLVTVDATSAPLLATFDTGAQGITIRRSVAERLGLPVVGEVLMGSPLGGQPVAVKLVGLSSLRVDGVAANQAPRSLDAALVDDARMLVGTDLVIGPNQFPQALIELDLAQQRFRLKQPASVAPNDWLPTNSRGLLETELQLGDYKVPAYVDTGKSGWIDLPKHMANGLNLLTPLKPVGKARVVGREIDVEGAEFKGPLTVGGIRFNYAGELRFADIPVAVVGTQALRQSVIRMDTAHRRWQLQPPASLTMGTL
jgi:predicted aspartyl protease